jgi:signal transduction histidine kinase/CheY-like chemotaxis protein
MQELAADLLSAMRLAVLAAFTSLAAAAVARAPRSGVTGWWVTAAFGSLVLALAAFWVPDAIGVRPPGWVGELALVLILAFPYLLLRFTASFRALPRWIEVIAAGAATGVVVGTLALLLAVRGDMPERPWVNWYIAGVLAYWVLVSLVTVVRLWRAGHRQPTLARRRMRLMSVATAVLAVALLMTVQFGDTSPLLPFAADLAALASAVAFGLGFSPPRPVRLSWRQPEEEHLRSATIAVLGAHTVEQVAGELLPPTSRVVGGRGAAMVDEEGRVVSTHGEAPALGTVLAREGSGARMPPSDRQVVPLVGGRGSLVVWTSPYTPFFGREEIDLLRGMGAVASLALERSELLAEERAQRSMLEKAQQEAEGARTEANRANMAKTEFLARMSHELRTPLNAILGFGQLLETADLDDEDQEGVQYILKAGRHLLALINDVLDLSRVEAGTLTISPEPVHTGELIRDTLTLIQPLADSRSIRLTASTAACDVYVQTDRQRCRQVLLNLLSNAVKYNHDGGQVDVSCLQADEGSLRIAVRDSGPGIDPALQERLFQPFERLGVEDSGVEGTGLGLALTRQLIERLGGTIGFETALGQGSTFWIDLPVTERPADCEEEAPPARTPAEAGERTLLLVEDNLANLRVVEAMLRRRPGVSVLPAMQGTLAIELAHEHQPDVIVLDLHLPDISGREVLYRLKADPRTRDIPVVIASADATPGRVRQLREEGAFDYVTKPLDLRHFLEVLDAAMARQGQAG